MDKRLFLALLLTTIVVVLTQTLFGPKPAPRSVAADSAAVAAPAASPQGAAAETARQATAAPAPAPAMRPGDSLPAAIVAPAAPETATIVAPRAIYRFTSLGAVPLATELRDYQSLRKGEAGKPVLLGNAGEPLLRYRLVGPGDTTDLSKVAFARVPVAGAHADSTVRYEATVNGGRVVIQYRVIPDSHALRVTGEVQNAASARFLLVDLPSTFRSAESDTVDDAHHLAYAYKPVKHDAKSIAFGKLDPGERHLETKPIAWVVAKSKYFLVGLLAEPTGRPFDELAVVGAPRTSKVVTAGHATALTQLDQGRFGFELYVGPQEWRRLRAMGRDFENANPYGGFMQGVVQPFATIVMRALLWMHEELKLSYGWVLVLFGVIIRLALWPLNQRAMRTSLRMQRVQPELQEIQKRYRDDPQKLQTEMMRVYREHGMSPFSAFSGCLPALIPMPVLFALFFVFQNTIEFRGVSFLWLPDISVMDPLYVLPVLVGISAFVVSWIGMRGSPPNPQAKMMAYIFPPMMTILFLRWPSGLNLYYAVQNLVTIPQQWLLARERVRSAPVATKPVPKPAPATGTRR